MAKAKKEKSEGKPKIISLDSAGNDYAFSNVLSDLKLTNKSERDLENELFGKKDANKIIDEFEKQLGYPQKTKPLNVRHRTRVFNMGHDDDVELFEQLINDKKKFTIMSWDKTWTVHGDYKMFIIYTENLDAAKEEDEKKENE